MPSNTYTLIHPDLHHLLVPPLTHKSDLLASDQVTQTDHGKTIAMPRLGS